VLFYSMRWVGTSGFQYPEWKGKFYPTEISARSMLPFYAERFSTTEINYSFRRIPSSEAVSNWTAASPPRFKFSFKAPQRITHFARLVNCAEKLEIFLEAISPMKRKLGAVLFQLPPNFKKDTNRLDDFLQILPQGFKYAFEFRHDSWFVDDVFGLLRKRKAALCLAENEELSTPRVRTANFGYLRLRREDYKPAMLRSWAKWVDEQRWSEAFVYFKHEERAIGPKFATPFLGFLEGK
jgi:uncharacterized protein YecE (DUF72 family)